MESERFTKDEVSLKEEAENSKHRQQRKRQKQKQEQKKNEASPSIKFKWARQHRHIQLLVALICLLARNWAPAAAETQQAGIKPPRGYCAPISRAIPSKSRCYDHLIIPANTNPSRGHAGRGSSSSLETSHGRAHPAPAATNTSGSAGKQEQQRLHHDDEIGPPAAAAAAAAAEELVYVRLETSGPSLAELTTRTINERLLVGVFNELLNPNRTSYTSLEKTAGGGGRREQISSIREQILDEPSGAGRQSDKCRLSIERLLCRLVYPSCHFRRADVSALVRPPCREDCLLARDVLCSNLNWPQFVAELQRAFNSTLMAAIKWPLQLEEPPAQAPDNDGEHDDETTRPRPTTSAGEISGLSSPAANRSGRSPMDDGGGDDQGSQLDSHHDHHDHHHRAVSVSPPPIHFYWPHERSLESCERLPPLRRPAGAIPSTRRQLIRGESPKEATPPRVDEARRRRRRRSSRSRHLRDRLGWPVCSSAHLTAAAAAALESPPLKDQQQQQQPQRTDCLDQKLDAAGMNYQGQLNRTSAGLECQPWASQAPHKHTSSQLLFDNMREAENYCRNPGGLELKPWCYTQDAQIRWQYCNVKPC